MSDELDPLLLEILRCPNCRGEVRYEPTERLVRCQGECRFEYPVVDGIPHMIVEEARKP